MTNKKCAAIFVLLLFLILIAGCETIKGAFTGMAGGMQRDWKAVQRVDDWMREKLW